MQFAFNASMMPAPSQVVKCDANEAIEKHLPYSKKIHETNFAISMNRVTFNKAQEKDQIPSNSPYGSWMNLHYPIGSNLKLRSQF
jgi:hypothetical protein